MPIKYDNLKAQTGIAFTFVRELYESAFPIEERRDWSSLLALIYKKPEINKEQEMQLDLISEDDEHLGFVIWWKIGDWMFVEHLAISEKARGKSYGARVMNHYLEISKNKLILEVEPPFSNDAKRRINFYERLGLKVLDFSYQQPSYREKEVYYPMLLMSTMGKDNEKHISELVLLLMHKVYFL